MSIKFKHIPILIGDKAMEYYNVGQAIDHMEYVVHNADYKKLKKIHKPDNKLPANTPGINYHVGNITITYYHKLYHMDYNKLKKKAVFDHGLFIVSPADLFLIKSKLALDKKLSKKQQTKEAQNMIALLNGPLKDQK